MATGIPQPILVVDDDPDILEALSEILESEGFEVDRAHNGVEALDQIASRRPRLVLLDLMMPVMDGFEVAQRLKREASSPPFVILSADRNVADRARELGAAGYLAKPFELTQLLSLIHSQLAAA